MKTLLILPLLCSLILMPGCSTPPEPAVANPPKAPEPAVATPSKEWIAHAKCIKTPAFMIYYEEGAEGSYTADGKEWHGMIPGPALLRQSQGILAGETVIAKGSRLYLEPGNKIRIVGATKIEMHN